MIEIMSKSHIYKLKVFVEDVDFGRVFYSRYLQYIERARTEMIYEKFNFTLTQLMNDHDVMFVVRTCNIKYLITSLASNGIFFYKLSNNYCKLFSKKYVKNHEVVDVTGCGDLVLSILVQF